jgi:hypothetical protein
VYVQGMMFQSWMGWFHDDDVDDSCWEQIRMRMAPIHGEAMMYVYYGRSLLSWHLASALAVDVGEELSKLGLRRWTQLSTLRIRYIHPRFQFLRQKRPSLPTGNYYHLSYLTLFGWIVCDRQSTHAV